MKPTKAKTVKVMTGTDIPLSSPSHPYAMAVQVKRVLDRIAHSSESEFEYVCNVPAGIKVFEKYGRGILGLNILFHINGVKAKYADVVADMERANNYIDKLINTDDEDN